MSESIGSLEFDVKPKQSSLDGALKEIERRFDQVKRKLEAPINIGGGGGIGRVGGGGGFGGGVFAGPASGSVKSSYGYSNIGGVPGTANLGNGSIPSLPDYSGNQNGANGYNGVQPSVNGGQSPAMRNAGSRSQLGRLVGRFTGLYAAAHIVRRDIRDIINEYDTGIDAASQGGFSSQQATAGFQIRAAQSTQERYNFGLGGGVGRSIYQAANFLNPREDPYASEIKVQRARATNEFNERVNIGVADQYQRQSEFTQASTRSFAQYTGGVVAGQFKRDADIQRIAARRETEMKTFDLQEASLRERLNHKTTEAERTEINGRLADIPGQRKQANEMYSRETQDANNLYKAEHYTNAFDQKTNYLNAVATSEAARLSVGNPLAGMQYAAGAKIANIDRRRQEVLKAQGNLNSIIKQQGGISPDQIEQRKAIDAELSGLGQEQLGVTNQSRLETIHFNAERGAGIASVKVDTRVIQAQRALNPFKASIMSVQGQAEVQSRLASAMGNPKLASAIQTHAEEQIGLMQDERKRQLAGANTLLDAGIDQQKLLNHNNVFQAQAVGIAAGYKAELDNNNDLSKDNVELLRKKGEIAVLSLQGVQKSIKEKARSFGIAETGMRENIEGYRSPFETENLAKAMQKAKDAEKQTQQDMDKLKQSDFSGGKADDQMIQDIKEAFGNIPSFKDIDDKLGVISDTLKQMAGT